MAFSPLTSVAVQGAGPYTSAAIDTTGADIIWMACSDNSGATLTVSDNQSNTWLTAPPTRYHTFGDGIQLKYALCTGKTNASHTFTAGDTNTFSGIAVFCASGVGASPLDQESGANNAASPGSITPTTDNQIVVSAFGWRNSITVTSVTGMTLVVQQDIGATDSGVGIAYVIQTTASAINPTWNYTGSPSLPDVSQASFKAAGGGGGFFSRDYYDMIGQTIQ